MNHILIAGLCVAYFHSDLKNSQIAEQNPAQSIFSFVNSSIPLNDLYLGVNFPSSAMEARMSTLPYPKLDPLGAAIDRYWK